MPSGLPPDRDSLDCFHKILLEEGAEPPSRPIYWLYPLELKKVEKQVTELLDKGLSQPSSSPYGAPIFFVKKKDGPLRMVLDYCICVKNRYLLPRIDDVLDQLHGANLFSSLDLMSGYHQIKIKDSNIAKTASRLKAIPVRQQAAWHLRREHVLILLQDLTQLTLQRLYLSVHIVFNSI